MNNYVRMIGTMIILVYSLAITFFILDRIFVNIIYFQGMLYTQIIGVPAFIFLNVIVILACIIMGSLLAYRQNEETSFLKNELDKLESSPLRGEPDHPLSPESMDVYHSIQKISETLNQVRRQNQIVTNDVHALNEEKVKQIVEEERQRLARELHDSVSQQLFAASMMLSALKSRNINADFKQQLELLEKMLHESQMEMRALLLHLRPVGLNNKTLEEGIVHLVNELKQKINMKITSHIEDITLEKGVEDHLFRIAQESISNTLRHSRAKNITIELFKAQSNVIFRIVDDGVGFDINEVDDTRYGLNTMKERALEIGGICHVISAKDSGTRIEVKIPLEAGEVNESTIR